MSAYFSIKLLNLMWPSWEAFSGKRKAGTSKWSDAPMPPIEQPTPGGGRVIIRNPSKSSNNVQPTLFFNIIISPRSIFGFGLLLFFSSILLIGSFQYQYASSYSTSISSTAGKTTYDGLAIFTLLMHMDDTVKQKKPEGFIHQWNAISSWKELVPDENILVFAADQFSCDYITAHLKVRCLLDVPCIEPFNRRTDMSCIWWTAHQHSTIDTMVFVNADIILMEDFIDTVKYMKQKFERNFVLIGQRTDVQLNQIVDFTDPAQVLELGNLVESEGQYHGEWGLDYFVHSKSQFEESIEFPRFLAGVFRWDNWLLSEFIISPTIRVIDATLSVRAIHQDDSGRSDHWERSGASYNDDLAKSTSAFQYKIGNVLFADLLIDGKCSSNSVSKILEKKCQVRENTERDMETILKYQRKSKSLNLAVIWVYSDYVDLAKNWICWAKRTGFDNFIFFALDQESHRELMDLDVPVVIQANAPSKISSNDNLKSELLFQELNLKKIDFANSVLYLGLNLLLTGPDSIWMDDPFRYMDHIIDIGYDLNRSSSSPSSIYLRNSEPTRTFWSSVKKCQESNIRMLQKEKSISDDKLLNHNFEYCIRSISYQMISESQLNVQKVFPELFPSSERFFVEHFPQKNGIWPVIIPSDVASSAIAKRELMQKWNLWLVRQNGDCEGDNVTPMKIDHVSIKIRVMASKNPEALSKLLKSLEKARYGSNELSLEISIDYPPEKANAEELKSHRDILRIAREFNWASGKKILDVATVHRGETAQWLEGWNPVQNSEVLVVLEENCEISSAWFLWLKESLESYYVDARDERLFGILLDRQSGLISGTSNLGGHNIPHYLTGKEAPLYKHPLISGSSAVLFPKQWREFMTWYQQHKDVSPCVPNVNWDSEANHWVKYHAQFAFEKGYYGLHTNWIGNSALVINPVSSPTWELLRSLTPEELIFPESNEIPIYDFQMNEIKQSPAILSERKRIFPSSSVGNFESEYCFFSATSDQ